MTSLRLPAWVAIACWPLIVVLALGSGALGGTIAVAGVFSAVAAGAALVYFAA